MSRLSKLVIAAAMILMGLFAVGCASEGEDAGDVAEERVC
jgi:hypothetical protein